MTNGPTEAVLIPPAGGAQRADGRRPDRGDTGTAAIRLADPDAIRLAGPDAIRFADPMRIS